MKRLPKMNWQSLKNRQGENQKVLVTILEDSSLMTQENNILTGTTVVRKMDESLLTMEAPTICINSMFR